MPLQSEMTHPCSLTNGAAAAAAAATSAFFVVSNAASNCCCASPGVSTAHVHTLTAPVASRTFSPSCSSALAAHEFILGSAAALTSSMSSSLARSAPPTAPGPTTRTEICRTGISPWSAAGGPSRLVRIAATASPSVDRGAGWRGSVTPRAAASDPLPTSASAIARALPSRPPALPSAWRRACAAGPRRSRVADSFTRQEGGCPLAAPLYPLYPYNA